MCNSWAAFWREPRLPISSSSRARPSPNLSSSVKATQTLTRGFMRGEATVHRRSVHDLTAMTLEAYLYVRSEHSQGERRCLDTTRPAPYHPPIRACVVRSGHGGP